MSLEPFSPSNHHHHHHHVIVTRKSLLASRPRRPTWFCRTTRSRGSALLDFSTGEQGSSHHHGRGGPAGWGKNPIFPKLGIDGLPLLIDYLTSATLIVIISVIIIIYHYFTDYPTWPPWTWAGTRLWRLNKELLRELTALMRCEYLYLYLELNLRERTALMRCE